jgi:hypothetical protein
MSASRNALAIASNSVVLIFCLAMTGHFCFVIPPMAEP